MKENIFGPRQWAFVVITGGAACALPFLQTDNSPTSTDNALTQTDSVLTQTDTALTSSQHGSSSGGRSRLASSGSVGEMVPPLPEPRLPEWANADRSPFDDLVGVTADKPEAAPPSEQLPMQPLRPWIAGPGDAEPLVSASAQPAAPARASAANGAIARGERSAAEASPWSDPPKVGFTPIDQRASSPLPSPTANTGGAGAREADDRWPDQAVSDEEIAQATRSRERELASAIAAPPPLSASHSSALLAAPALPSATLRSTSQTPPTFSTLPVAAQRQSGQAYLSPGSATLRAPSLSSSPERDDVPQRDRSDGAPTTGLNLPPLPAQRKSHIIFQPGSWK